jgi:DNA-binding transcriptional MerR regulator
MPMLTIGQLAAQAGVTVRAIRHYHQRGLLAEPARDASGYRRYDAPAVVDLIRIKTLADAGVPLARIRELLKAKPGEFAEAITQIDEALKKKIQDLTHHRRRIADSPGASGCSCRLRSPAFSTSSVPWESASRRCRSNAMAGSCWWRSHRSWYRNG